MGERSALAAFRTVLAAALLYGSVRTVFPEVAHGGLRLDGNPHLVLLGSVEALGALLLFFRPSRTAGAVLLLLTIGLAFLVHVLRRELRPDLLVYAAGVGLVLVHHRRGPRDAGGALPD